MRKSVVSVHQPSITEWFAAIGEKKEAEAFREEDNRKSDRLEVLYQTTGLPYERPEPFPARDLVDLKPSFKKILSTRGRELCALRLVPNKPGLPKLRNRGLSIRRAYETWFKKLEIDPDAYTVYVCPHSDKLKWSAIFLVTKQGIFGEIVRGLHSQLTQGETKSAPIQFQYNFHKWQWSRQDKEAVRLVKEMIKKLQVTPKRQRVLKKKLTSQFKHGYLLGYFETTVWPDNKLYFIDYNRLLPKFIGQSFSASGKKNKKAVLTGVTGGSGIGKGKVVIVNEKNLGRVKFPPGSVLVCDNTDVRYLPFMQRASAIVTDRGGILSHAAIVSRELKKPCIIGTRNATRLLKTGDSIEVDATRGEVVKL